jgi:hypothetical protein
LPKPRFNDTTCRCAAERRTTSLWDGCGHAPDDPEVKQEVKWRLWVCLGLLRGAQAESLDLLMHDRCCEHDPNAGSVILEIQLPRELTDERRHHPGAKPLA